MSAQTLLFHFTSSPQEWSLLQSQEFVRKPGFCSFRVLCNFTLNTPQLRISYNPESLFPLDLQLSDAEEDDDDEEETTDEYRDKSADVLGEAEIESSAYVSESFSWSSESMCQRVQKLCEKMRELGEGLLNVDELASIYDFPIDKFQRLAIEAFLRGSSVIVSAPTSSGKTLIAEAAAVATVARGRRLFYTAPLKALSNQKFRQFCETFGRSKVGLLTGDSTVNKDAQVLIMTTEILRNMLYHSVGTISSGNELFHVDVIVLDEVHFLSDLSRGTVWEEIVIYCPKEVQLICLSATVANADELAGWVGQIHGKTELITSSKRPVPLTWHFSTKTSLSPLLDSTCTSINRKLLPNCLQICTSGFKASNDERSSRRNIRKRQSSMNYSSTANMSGRPLSKSDINMIRHSQVPHVKDTLHHLHIQDMLPAIWFIFSRQGCDAAVKYVEDCSLLDECEISEVEVALKRFRSRYPDAVRESAIRGLMHGVAAHHAGCLPLWKLFIEDLFQQGLVKVVFATETLAAGINMPARTAVIASMNKRDESGPIRLSSNELLQMAGRAGRRGIDERGHVVLVQTPYEDANECCKLLFAGTDPLVSQFTASYGMALNLLAGEKVTSRSKELDNVKDSTAGRSLEEAKRLVEQSFGNYVGSDVMLSAKKELVKIEKEIEMLTTEVGDEAIDRKSRNVLSGKAYREITDLLEELRAEKRQRTELRKNMELKRISALKSLLKELKGERLPFICLDYKDDEGVQHSVPAVYLDKVESFEGLGIGNTACNNDSFALDDLGAEKVSGDSEIQHEKSSYHVALGSNNSWYIFTEKWLKTVYSTGFPNIALAKGEALPREIMSILFNKEQVQWIKLADSEIGGLWHKEGSLETWSWSLNVPVLSSLSEFDEVLHKSPSYNDAVASYKNQRTTVSRLKKKIAHSEAFRKYKKIVDISKFTEEKISHLKARSNYLNSRVHQIEPFGWKEFLQVSNVIHEARALDINTRLIFPLGETAARIQGENELWLAMVLRSKILLDLKPAQLAAVCGSLVSEGIKIRPRKNNGYIYEPSATVIDVIHILDEQRSFLLRIQERHGVKVPCCLDLQFSGMVEAWAMGLSWREITMDCAMDEGDLARLLKRTIDLLAQIPRLPDIDSVLKSNASMVSGVMDRSPISEQVG